MKLLQYIPFLSYPLQKNIHDELDLNVLACPLIIGVPPRVYPVPDLLVRVDPPHASLADGDLLQVPGKALPTSA